MEIQKFINSHKEVPNYKIKPKIVIDKPEDEEELRR